MADVLILIAAGGGVMYLMLMALYWVGTKYFGKDEEEEK